MLKFDEVGAWVLIAGGAGYASSPLTKLVSAGRSGTRIPASPVQVWSGLFLGLMILADGVSWLYGFHSTLVVWVGVALLIAYWIALSVLGGASHRKAGLPWWRFWVRVTPSPDPIGVPGSGLATAPGAETAALILRIKNAKFGTTRLSPGYDEQEVDAFIDKLIILLAEDGRLDPAELRNVQFSTTRIRPGYTVQDVDNFLDDVEQAI